MNESQPGLLFRGRARSHCFLKLLHCSWHVRLLFCCCFFDMFIFSTKKSFELQFVYPTKAQVFFVDMLGFSGFCSFPAGGRNPSMGRFFLFAWIPWIRDPRKRGGGIFGFDWLFNPPGPAKYPSRWVIAPKSWLVSSHF